MGPETSSRDIELFLRVLATGTRADEKRAIWDDLPAAGVSNINLQPVTYSAIRVTENIDRDARKDSDRSLWDQILAGLLENRQFADKYREKVHIDSADELAMMIA